MRYGGFFGLFSTRTGENAWHDARMTSFFMYNPEFLKGTLDIAPLAASIHNPLSTRDGKERKFVIGKNKEEFALIEKTGIANLTPDQLQAMVEKYFFS